MVGSFVLWSVCLCLCVCGYSEYPETSSYMWVSGHGYSWRRFIFQYLFEVRLLNILLMWNRWLLCSGLGSWVTIDAAPNIAIYHEYGLSHCSLLSSEMAQLTMNEWMSDKILIIFLYLKQKLMQMNRFVGYAPEKTLNWRKVCDFHP